MYTDLPKNCQGPALVLSLEGEAQDVVLEFNENDFSKDNGVDFIIIQLDKLFKKNSFLSTTNTLR